jgi:hypothetical protein
MTTVFFKSIDWEEIGIGEIREGVRGEISERECRIGGFFV